ncbi:MAG: phosphatase PAP2 family protein [Candidatus Symbiothrix sp.]|jgi:membrane-associated phospholipid phosphatase|nr:phosphatase PAP2 family protein [Candidatus Symbiothrix sp.]
MKSLIKILSKNKYFYLTVAVLTLIEGSALLLSNKANVTLWVNTHWSSFIDESVLDVNAIGSTFFSIVVVVFLWIEQGFRPALKATVCFMAVMLITQFTKHILFPGSIRPTLYFEEGTLRLLGVKQLTTESFPSGHTAASFAIATFFALTGTNKKLHWVFALLAFAVSYGRLYMSQHFITDVFAGMLIGVIVTSLIYIYYPEKWDQPVT